MKRTEWIVALLLALAAGHARADIWECTDGSGNRRFTNIRSEAKGCKLLQIAPPVQPASAKPSAAPAATATPRDFPKVDGDTQRQRDADRRKILQQELSSEQKQLEEAKRELSEQESQRFGSERNYQRVLERLEPFRKKVKLHEDNVANLQRELTRMR